MDAAATEASLDRAEALCARRGAQLTALRRQVLRLVISASQPVGAYALLDQLKQSRAGAAPPTVYRALDFLVEQGLIHKVERLNAFIGCIDALDHPEDCDCAETHDHPHQFLICRRCGRTTEISDPGVALALSRAARAAGFTPGRATVELEGLCAECAG
ncbi:transcriptional repressor [Siccirubricoccus sp. KC 17139]|uniref:Ferric uptake regulation protein n=1 Tax=Siccirubricoccus soli TaxID=2899147 RepID=A0ABT1D5M5_9PROT|nr:Fur family transcriptional regulator [Siccirubricoccus soli]MCO6417206.1 transcriptional repressor [Siccirubricoccus soli]MCP2683341.1 transcriptional repressor [Siccirubricoccus soli]